MKKVKRFVVLILLFLFTVVDAQNYHITDFRPDSLKTWRIWGTLSTGYDDNSAESEYDDTDDDNSGETKSFSFTPTIRYDFKKITKHREIYGQSTLTTNLSNYKTVSCNNDNYFEDQNSNSNTRRVIHAFSNQIVWREYVWKNLSFEGRGVVSCSFNNRNISQYDKKIDRSIVHTSDTDLKSSQYSYILSPGIIYGRTYNRNYAAKADEILSELEKTVMLKRSLTNEEFQTFSMKILRHTEKYHYDSRIRNIAALKELITYLSDIGVVDKCDIASVLTINDVYLFSPSRTQRNFGSQIYLNYSYSETRSPSKDVYSTKATEWFVNQSVITDSVVYDESVKNRYNRTGNTYPNTTYLGISINRVYNWHFWYSFNVEYNHLYQIETKKNIYSHNHIYTPLIEHNSKDTTTFRGAERDDGISGSIILNYQLNSRSIFSLPIYATRSFSRGEYKYSYYDDKLKFRNREISVNCYPSLTYFLTPKWSIRSGVSLYHTKVRYSISKTTVKSTTASFDFYTSYYL